eukprot:SAG22_NODE_4596_length_1221_cov_2.888592_2_plen_138_part_00
MVPPWFSHKQSRATIEAIERGNNFHADDAAKARARTAIEKVRDELLPHHRPPAKYAHHDDEAELALPKSPQPRRSNSSSSGSGSSGSRYGSPAVSVTSSPTKSPPLPLPPLRPPGSPESPPPAAATGRRRLEFDDAP